MRLQKNIVFVGLMFTSAVLLAAEDILKNSGGQVSVLFTDINVFRRSLDSAPKIGGGNEDFRVQIACMGTADCIGKISKLYDLVTLNRKNVASCKVPIYARIKLQPDMFGYGESADNVQEIYDIDFTGRCVTHRGRSYKIEKSIFEILNTLPVSAWGATPWPPSQ